MSTDKKVRRVTDPKQQEIETYQYWQSLSVGARLSAVWDLSATAYGFAAAYEQTSPDGVQRLQRRTIRAFKGPKG